MYFAAAGCEPFFSEKFDITKHPPLQNTLQTRTRKNTFDIDRFLSTLRRKRQQVVAQDESFDLYEIDLSDENAAELIFIFECRKNKRQKVRTLWNFSTAQSILCRRLWSVWAVPCVSGAASTCWRATDRITPAAMLMYGREAQSKTRIASPATIPKSGERNRKIHSCMLYLISI